MHLIETTLKALADKNRLRIIGMLMQKKLCVCELAYVLKITQPSVSKHLKKLKQAGIIGSEKDGFWTNYFILPDVADISWAFLQLIRNLLASSPGTKADLKLASKADRNKLCCR